MKFSRDQIFVAIISLLIIGLIGGWVKRLTLLPLYWVSVVLLVAHTIYFNRKIRITNLILFPSLVGLVLVFYDLFGHYNDVPDVYLYPFGPPTDIYPFVLSALILINIFSSFRQHYVIIKLNKISIWLFAIGCAFSLITETFYPGISRIRDLDEVPRYFWTFTFGTFYSLPFLTLALLSDLRGVRKFLVGFLILAISAYSGFLTLMIFTLAAILISYFDSFAKWLKVLTVFGGVVLITIIGSIGLNRATIAVLSFLPHEEFAAKAAHLEEISNDNSADVEDLRGDVYSASVDSFISRPLFGVGSYSERFIGYHSFWLDKLGFIGLFGTLFYLIIFYSFYRYIYNWLYPWVLSWKRVNILLFVLLFLNPFQFWDFWIVVYVIVPIIIKVKSLKYSFT